MSNWKLTSDFDLLQDYTGNVWIVDCDQKHKDSVKKKIKIATKETHLEDGRLKLKVDEYLDIWLEHSGKWCKVMNLEPENLGRIISQTNICSGEMIPEFEAAFRNDLGTVSLVHEGMEEYDEYFEETVRQVNCSLHKKVKKWIPGHRYDSQTDTYYYLGQFISHKKNDIDSEFIDEGVPVYLVTKSIKGISTVTEALSRKDGLYKLYRLPSMVDSGEALVDDSDGFDLTSTWEMLISENVSLPSLLQRVDICGSYEPNPDIVEYAKEKISEAINSVLIKYYDVKNVFSSDMEISSKKTKEQNTEACLARLWQEIGEENVMASTYYSELFNQLGFKFVDFVSDLCSNFDLKNAVFSDFENYRKHASSYFAYHNSGDSHKYVSLTGNATIQGTYGEGHLTKALVSLVNEAIKSEGQGVKSFELSNQGTRRNQRISASMTITIGDLVESGISEEVEREIMDKQFFSLSLDTYCDKPIK